MKARAFALSAFAAWLLASPAQAVTLAQVKACPLFTGYTSEGRVPQQLQFTASGAEHHAKWDPVTRRIAPNWAPWKPVREIKETQGRLVIMLDSGNVWTIEKFDGRIASGTLTPSGTIVGASQMPLQLKCGAE